MDEERMLLRQALSERTDARTWLVLGQSSEQTIPLVSEFLGSDPAGLQWHMPEIDDDDQIPVHLHDGHVWIDGEAVRPCSLENWRRYLTNLAEGTTLDYHLNRGIRWIVVRGIEVLSAEQLGCLADALGRGGRGWLLLAAASGFPRYQRIAQRSIWWAPGPRALGTAPAYRLTLPARATMSSFSHMWGQFMKGRATLEELDESWLQMVARDVPWEQTMSLVVREALHAPDRAKGRAFLLALLEVEKRPRQRDIFTWRWILHLAHETFSTSKP